MQNIKFSVSYFILSIRVLLEISSSWITDIRNKVYFANATYFLRCANGSEYIRPSCGEFTMFKTLLLLWFGKTF